MGFIVEIENIPLGERRKGRKKISIRAQEFREEIFSKQSIEAREDSNTCAQ